MGVFELGSEHFKVLLSAQPMLTNFVASKMSLINSLYLNHINPQ